jgi:hypothetical protein
MRHEIAFSTRIARTARTLALVLAALALSWGHPAVAAEPTPDEVKARFVFQLLKYVTWPEAAAPATAPFVVGVLGDEGFAATLRQVVGSEQAQGRAVEIRALADGVQPGIHLLFLADKDAGNLRNLAREQHGTAVLTVADRFDFPDLGGDVGLELVSGKVSFSINRRKSVRGDLVISSKLMRLASDVK